MSSISPTSELKMENTTQNPMASIQRKLDVFYETQKIPHLIFHGASGSGKMTLVFEFINKIYGNDRAKIKSNVMVVNCSHGKGIKFIRDDLKFFAKTNIQTNSVLFKTILLLNAHHLTIDAQSALRRCIEVFSHNTRFFIVVENKNKLLNPILSRFCEIYVPEPMVDGEIQNLNTTRVLANQGNVGGAHARKETIDTIVHQYTPAKTHTELADMCVALYDEGISCLDVVEWLQQTPCPLPNINVTEILMFYYRVKNEFRCEKMLMFYTFLELFARRNKIDAISP